jgi:FkbM family methyltransferase
MIVGRARHAPSGLWFPDNCNADAGFEYMIRRVTDIDVALPHCWKKAVAVQAGGNVGLWPRRLAKHFELVHTFEPVPYIRACLVENVRHLPQVIVHDALLSDEPKKRVPFKFRKGGTSRVVETLDDSGGIFAESTTIDSLKLSTCDALFLDVEGHELEVLAGAEETIEKYNPLITVEVWDCDDTRERYRLWFEMRGYTQVARVHSDFTYSRRKT